MQMKQEQITAWDNEIVINNVSQFKPSLVMAGKCEKHGEYSKNDCINSQCRSDGTVCPHCYAIEQEEKKKEENRRIAKNLILGSGLPPRFYQKTFDTYIAKSKEQKNLLKIMQHYADDFENAVKVGRSLVLHGKTGTGKTHLACAILQDVVFKFLHDVRYTTAYHLVRDIKSSFSNREKNEAEIVQGFIDPELLIVDEVGVQFGSDTEKLFLFEVLNGRYEWMRPTIVVSNLEPKEITEYLGDRVMDRLKENSGAEFAFNWESFRS